MRLQRMLIYSYLEYLVIGIWSVHCAGWLPGASRTTPLMDPVSLYARLSCTFEIIECVDIFAYLLRVCVCVCVCVF